jgi:hypothetical protein
MLFRYNQYNKSTRSMAQIYLVKIMKIYLLQVTWQRRLCSLDEWSAYFFYGTFFLIALTCHIHFLTFNVSVVIHGGTKLYNNLRLNYRLFWIFWCDYIQNETSEYAHYNASVYMRFIKMIELLIIWNGREVDLRVTTRA